MSNELSERRLAENEAYYRLRNEAVQRGFDDLKAIAHEDGQPGHEADGSMVFHFYCECSDEKCRQRIHIPLDTYNEIHKNRKAFVIVCGHEIEEYERIIRQEPGYCVSEKYKNPPKAPKKLNRTPLNNT